MNILMEKNELIEDHLFPVLLMKLVKPITHSKPVFTFSTVFHIHRGTVRIYGCLINLSISQRSADRLGFE